MTIWTLRRAATWVAVAAVTVTAALGVRDIIASAPDPANSQRAQTPPTESHAPPDRQAGEQAPDPGVPPSPHDRDDWVRGDAAADSAERAEGSAVEAPPSQADRYHRPTNGLGDAVEVAEAFVAAYTTTDPDEPAADYADRVTAYATDELAASLADAAVLADTRPDTPVTATVVDAELVPEASTSEQVRVVVTVRLDGVDVAGGRHRVTVALIRNGGRWHVAEVVI